MLNENLINQNYVSNKLKKDFDFQLKLVDLVGLNLFIEIKRIIESAKNTIYQNLTKEKIKIVVVKDLVIMIIEI